MQPAIEVDGVYFAYDESHWVLRDIRLQIDPGEFVAIIGQNGSGKTTLVKHFDGLLKPQRGVVRVDGVETTELNLAQLAGKVGYCFQNPDHQIFHATVEEEIEFGPKHMGVSRKEVSQHLEEVLETVGLSGFREEYPFALSRGQRQKLAVGSILAMNPPTIIVDEPTTGMDWRDGLAMMRLIKKLNDAGRTIVIITHDMQIVASYAQRVIVMSRGRILDDGPTREIFAKPEVMSESYLEPPQITRLGQKLGSQGIPANLLTVEEAVDEMAWRLGGGDRDGP